MPVNAPISNPIDIGLPTLPKRCADPTVNEELALIYSALRSLQSSTPHYLGSYTTVLAPTYIKGAMYFDTTLNKFRIGGAAAWETVTSV